MLRPCEQWLGEDLRIEPRYGSANKKMLHTADMLCIGCYKACQRKDRASSWNDCHSRVAGRSVSTASAGKKAAGISCTRFSNEKFGFRPGGLLNPRCCSKTKSNLILTGRLRVDCEVSVENTFKTFYVKPQLLSDPHVIHNYLGDFR